MASCAVFDVSTVRCRGITGEEEEDRQRPPRRPLGPMPNTFVFSSPSSSLPAFSSDDEEDDQGSTSSFCSSTSFSDDEGGEDEVNSSSSAGLKANSPLSKMSDLMAQLPIKRGLSRHYNGKSQSFTSLATVASVEDLRKPERGPARKKLKSCRSFGGGMANVMANASHNTFGFFLPPVPAASPVKPAPAAAAATLQRPSPLTMLAADRSGAGTFLRTNTTRLQTPPLPPQHRHAGFTASHPPAMLFA